MRPVDPVAAWVAKNLSRHGGPGALHPATSEHFAAATPSAPMDALQSHNRPSPGVLSVARQHPCVDDDRASEARTGCGLDRTLRVNSSSPKTEELGNASLVSYGLAFSERLAESVERIRGEQLEAAATRSCARSRVGARRSGAASANRPRRACPRGASAWRISGISSDCLRRAGLAWPGPRPRKRSGCPNCSGPTTISPCSPMRLELRVLIDERRGELLVEAGALGRRVNAERPKAFARRVHRHLEFAGA